MNGTIPPCPSWCVHPDGHDFQEIGYVRLRTHEGPVVNTRWCSITVYADEGFTEEETTITRVRPRVRVDTDGDRALDGPGLRQLAAALLNAADECDRITATSGLVT